MSLPTMVQCPQCGQTVQTTKSISPGAAVRCKRCNSSFRFASREDNPNRSLAVLGGVDQSRLDELFAADSKPKPTPPSREVDMRVPNESIEPLPRRAQLASSAGPKKVVLEGKPLPFHGPRTIFAGMLLAVLGLAGYGFVRWYVDTVISLDATATKAGQKRASKIAALAKPAGTEQKPKKGMMGMGSFVSPAPAKTESRAIAPATAQIGDLVVGVSAAVIETSGQNSADGYLTLTLRITNLSAKAITHFSWSGPSHNVILTDQYHNYYNRIVSSADPDQVIEPSRTITETLQFEKPPQGVVLALDIPHVGQKFEFTLPAPFVRVVTAPKAPPVTISLTSLTVQTPAPSPVAESPLARSATPSLSLT
jgi:DNA-directed RNA polymerase subunit RPC12/RpoP